MGDELAAAPGPSQGDAAVASTVAAPSQVLIVPELSWRPNSTQTRPQQLFSYLPSLWVLSADALSSH